jgi:hypothetical protein
MIASWHGQKRVIADQWWRDDRVPRNGPGCVVAQSTPDARIHRTLTAGLHRRDGDNPSPTKK